VGAQDARASHRYPEGRQIPSPECVFVHSVRLDAVQEADLVATCT
jgi:hypothetical protein